MKPELSPATCDIQEISYNQFFLKVAAKIKSIFLHTYLMMIESVPKKRGLFSSFLPPRKIAKQNCP